ncbi:MAG: hypothetical protein ACRDO4_12880 [Nocardioides sp.]
MDAQLDWRVTSGHYDLRIVRSCMPGGFNETDPTGNGYWEEPNGWTSGTNMRRGYGYMIDDDYGLFGWDTFDIRMMAGTEGSALQEPPPRTSDCKARTRTRYQDGHVEATPNNGAPYTSQEGC